MHPEELPLDVGSRSKRCPACGAMKPLDQFPKNKRSRDGHAFYCKPCHNQKGRESRERNHGSVRSYHLKARYGITGEQAAEMLDAQDGLCAICRERPADHVDHDHLTGRVRGLLCFNCNGGLGQFRDDPELLRAALDYLDRHVGEVARERAASLRGT
jgi:hypothetical protein